MKRREKVREIMKLIDADRLKKDFVKTCGAIPFVYGRNRETIYIDKFIDEQPEREKCGECSRRKWYQKGYEDAKREKWIPVSERLPERETEVLFCWKYGDIKVAAFWEEDNVIFDGDFLTPIDSGKIVAWMPLPEPYKGDINADT